MKLREWQYINKPAGSASSAPSNAGNKSFKKRFEKLISYYGQHLLPGVDYITVNLLTSGSLNFTEHYTDGDKIQYDIFIDDFDTEDWGIKIKVNEVNEQSTEKYFGKGWHELLNTLGTYIALPQTGDPEYKNLLTEWVLMKNNSATSSGYKKRFEKLIKYHIDHASSELESVTKKDITSKDFLLGEHYNTGTVEFDRYIVVSVDKYSGTFFLNIIVNDKQVYHNVYNSYEEVLEILTGTYMFLPDVGTQEYNDLLTESLNEWQYKNPPNASQPVQVGAAASAPKSAANYPSQEDLYKKLLAQIDSDKTYSYTVNLLDDRILAITVNSTNGGIGLKIIFKPYVPCYLLLLTTKEDVKEVRCDDFEDVLAALLFIGLIKHMDLFESAGSIADDFKLYENLWD